ncbi:hypothetical protein AVEN_192313-1, partial [Araneus ventricosus]
MEAKCNQLECINVIGVKAVLNTGTCDPNRKDARGPIFRMEPPSRVEFSNNSGTELRCSADGYPTPRLTWLTREGSPARDVPGLR